MQLRPGAQRFLSKRMRDSGNRTGRGGRRTAGIWLVDDVLGSGATVQEAARALGTAVDGVLVLARTVAPGSLSQGSSGTALPPVARREGARASSAP